MKTFGEAMKQARKEQNLTYEELRKKMDRYSPFIADEPSYAKSRSNSYLCQIERGVKLPAMNTFIELVDVLGLNRDEMYELYKEQYIDEHMARWNQKAEIALENYLESKKSRTIGS